MAVVAAAGALSACSLWNKTHELRYRVTVEVDTPAGLRTGSSVVEVKVRNAAPWELGSPVKYGIRGEAVFVDLPGGKVLFALLNHPGHPDSSIHLPFQTFSREVDEADPRDYGEGPDWKKRVRHLMRVQPTAELTGTKIPALVRFRNLNDPTTGEEVQPNRLSDYFGKGYSLRRVTISVTKDPVLERIRSKLPWLTDDSGKSLVRDLDPYDTSIPAILRHGDFARNRSP